MTTEVTIDMLRKLVSYDPATGILTWKHRPVEMFRDGKQSAQHNTAIWNGKHAGKPANRNGLAGSTRPL